MGEHSRTTAMRPRGSVGTLPLTSLRVNRNPRTGFRPVGNSLAWGDTSSAPGCRIQETPLAPSGERFPRPPRRGPVSRWPERTARPRPQGYPGKPSRYVRLGTGRQSGSAWLLGRLVESSSSVNEKAPWPKGQGAVGGWREWRPATRSWWRRRSARPPPREGAGATCSRCSRSSYRIGAPGGTFAGGTTVIQPGGHTWM